MFSSLMLLAEDIVIDGTLEDGTDPMSEFDKNFDQVSNTVNIGFVVVGIALVVILGFGIFAGVRNYRAAKRHGMDPFAVETELAGRAYNSALLAPPPGAAQPGQAGQPAQHAGTKTERLQEIEDMYRNGAITSSERQRARDAILTED